MALYKVVVSKSATKEMAKLPAVVNNQIIPAILDLSKNPRPIGSTKLKGNTGNWRIRIGDYRVLYNIEDKLLIIDIRKVGHRKDVYK